MNDWVLENWFFVLGLISILGICALFFLLT